jgi:hypothetical protein
VLRLTISMARPEIESSEAAVELMKPLRAASAYVNAGRADMGTKTAVQLAFALGQKVANALPSLAG